MLISYRDFSDILDRYHFRHFVVVRSDIALQYSMRSSIRWQDSFVVVAKQVVVVVVVVVAMDCCFA